MALVLLDLASMALGIVIFKYFFKFEIMLRKNITLTSIGTFKPMKSSFKTLTFPKIFVSSNAIRLLMVGIISQMRPF